MFRAICIVGIFINVALITSTEINSSNFNSDDERELDVYNEGQNLLNGLEETIPGVPSSDYPTYTSIPRTAFSCRGRVNWGYYADIESECQVFHVCDGNESKISFLCPVGTIFNQKNLVCDWWYKFNCRDAISFSEVSGDFNNHALTFDDGDQTSFDLSLSFSHNETDRPSTKFPQNQ